jgi:hypothetical protein
MGAVDIHVIKIGKYKTVGEAYRDAQREADDAYGHCQGRSGAINSTHSITRAIGGPRYGTAIFHVWAKKSIEDLEIGDLLYIELGKGQIKKYKPSNIETLHGVKGYVFFGWARE